MAGVYERVLSFIAAPESDDFGEIALAVFRHQFESCAPYRAYCESRDATPGLVGDWRAIPPVPIVAFKETDLCCGEPERVFLSTGTTAGPEKRSRHALPMLRLYRESAVAGLRRFLLPDIERIDMVSLIADATQQPDSSLAQMVAWAGEAGARSPIVYAVEDGQPRFDRLVEALRHSEATGEPLCIFTTTGALIHFFDWTRGERLEFRLPHGSRIMDTGGGKGAPRPVSRKGILHAIWSTFAIPGYFAVNEYGMAELSSQYYDSVIRDRFDGTHRKRRLLAPPWLRPLILDLRSLEPVEDGETGLICHFDIANAGTAMAICSEDLGVIEDGALRLIGRAPEAELRGCSLSSAEWNVA